MPDIDVLAKLADYYNVSADYLIGRDSEPSRNADLKAVCKYTGLSGKSVNQIISANKNGGNLNLLLENDNIATLCEFLESNARTAAKIRFYRERVQQISNTLKLFDVSEECLNDVVQKLRIAYMHVDTAFEISISLVNNRNFNDVMKSLEYRLDVEKYRGTQLFNQIMKEVENNKQEQEKMRNEYDVKAFAAIQDIISSQQEDLSLAQQIDNGTALLVQAETKALKQYLAETFPELMKGADDNGSNKRKKG